MEELALPQGCRLVGVELLDEAVDLPSFRHPLRAAYVLGPEQGSLSPDLLARCDHVVRIPSSFCINLAMAGAIVMYDRVRCLGRFPPRPLSEGGPVGEPMPMPGGSWGGAGTIPEDRAWTPLASRYVDWRRGMRPMSPCTATFGWRLSGTARKLSAAASRLKMLSRTSWFSDRLGSSTVLGAFRGTELVGMAGFAIQQGQKRAHKGLLWGMYVRPSARTGGVGRRLIEAILDVARQHVELIQLTVVHDNVRARRLYASLGFVDYGLERHALKQDGRYYDEVLMAKDLLDEPARSVKAPTA